MIDEEMAEQPAAGVQDLIRRYRERVRIASRQLGELQIAVAIRDAQLAERQREIDLWRGCAETAERRLELSQDEVRFQSARAAYYYAAYTSAVPDETLQVQRFSQYARESGGARPPARPDMPPPPPPPVGFAPPAPPGGEGSGQS